MMHYDAHEVRLRISHTLFRPLDFGLLHIVLVTGHMRHLDYQCDRHLSNA